MTEHPDRRTLDRLAVGDLPARDARTVEVHVAGCDTCGAYRTELDVARAVRVEAMPPGAFLAALAGRRAANLRRRRLVRGAVGGLALASLALVLVLGRAAPTPSDQPRYKGAAVGVIVHRKRGEAVSILGEAGGVRAGDVLRVELSLARRALVRVRLEDRVGALELTAGGAPSTLEPGTRFLPGDAVIQAPCVDLALVVEVDGVLLRRELVCE